MAQLAAVAIISGGGPEGEPDFGIPSINTLRIAAVSAASIGKIWSIWRRRPGNVVVPGHDIPMVQKDGRTEYLGKREAAIKAWFGDDLETTTTIELTVA